MYYKNLNDALFELGVTPRNREVSSYHLTQYIPTNSLDYILPQQQNTKEVKVQDRSAITESENSNKFGELEYLFPQQNLKGVTTIVENVKFINSVEDLTKIFENIRPSIEYFGKIKNNLLEGVNGLISGKLKQNLKKLKDETVKNRDKINEILDESVSLLKTMNKEMYNNKNIIFG